MKIIKAKIKVTHDGGGTQYVYPQIWLDNVANIPMVTYPNDRTDEVVDRTGSYQIVYPAVPDELYNKMLAEHPEIFSVANRLEFETYSDKHYPVKDRITDQDAVMTVLAKVALKEVLTETDEAVINPTSPTAGINKTERVVDTVTQKYGAIF